jgi:hypothetical protein
MTARFLTQRGLVAGTEFADVHRKPLRARFPNSWFAQGCGFGAPNWSDPGSFQRISHCASVQLSRRSSRWLIGRSFFREVRINRRPLPGTSRVNISITGSGLRVRDADSP